MKVGFTFKRQDRLFSSQEANVPVKGERRYYAFLRKEIKDAKKKQKNTGRSAGGGAF